MTSHTRDHASKHGIGQEDDIHSVIDHGSIQGLGDDDHTLYTKADGTRDFTGNQSMGGNKLTNLATATASGDAANKGYVDSKIQGIDWQVSVISRATTPPVSPVIGDRYLVIATATGDWVGQETTIAEWSGAEWVFTTPNDGYAIWVETEDITYVYNGTVWVIFGSTLDHGNLQGLSDDDHSQYVKADGTRAFTGVVSGVTPTADAHLTTRGWIQSSAFVKKIQVITNATEQAVPAGEVALWVDSDALEAVKYWLIYGTDGTVGGNKKVNLT